MFCIYYQAHVVRKTIWFVTGVFRNETNWIFDRTLDDKKSILEFFVPPDFEKEFLSRMKYFKKEGYVASFEKLPNRLKTDPTL